MRLRVDATLSSMPHGHRLTRSSRLSLAGQYLAPSETDGTVELVRAKVLWSFLQRLMKNCARLSWGSGEDHASLCQCSFDNHLVSPLKHVRQGCHMNNGKFLGGHLFQFSMIKWTKGGKRGCGLKSHGQCDNVLSYQEQEQRTSDWSGVPGNITLAHAGYIAKQTYLQRVASRVGEGQPA